MDIIYYTLSVALLLSTLLPLFPSQHWVFRIGDFGRIQLFFIALVLIIFGAAFVDVTPAFRTFQGMLMLSMIYQLVILFPYTSLYPSPKCDDVSKHSESVSILSANVYQFNEEHHRLLELIHEKKPQMVLTMESDEKWENSLDELRADYPHYIRIAQNNTYGMHLYSKLEVVESWTHYFVADDIPSIEARVKTPDGLEFNFFGVHPPPPSPTEEKNSKERDGELLSVAKRLESVSGPVVVCGDFNNVAWARSSKLFKRSTGLIDPRIGRGFVSTFHAKYRLLRFPIDLFFHSTDIFIEEFRTLGQIGSDHLPLWSKFYINYSNGLQEQQVEEPEEGDDEEIEKIIEEGIAEEGNREDK